MNGYVLIGLCIVMFAIFQYLIRGSFATAAVQIWRSLNKPEVAKTREHWENVTIRASIWLGVIGFLVVLAGLGSNVSP